MTAGFRRGKIDGVMSTATKLTYEDYVLMPDDGQRHELIDGELFVVPAPATRHQLISGNLYLILAPYVRARNAGTVAYAPLDVRLSPIDVVQPDLIFVKAENAARITGQAVEGPPDLAVEILSDSNRRHDEVTKRALYERFGVPEYWLIDPDARTVNVLRLTEGAYSSAVMLREGDTLTSPLFPGLEISLTSIFTI